MIDLRTLCLSAAIFCASTAAWAAEPTPFTLPIPDGFRTETIPFPLDFAPDLPYSGIEELRFSPGMFDEASDGYWSYAFVWWVATENGNSDVESLTRHLESYFRGLAATVAPSKGFDLSDARFSVELADGEDGKFSGTAHLPDAFVTGQPISLSVDGRVVDCPRGNTAVLFTLSPQARSHGVWIPLQAIKSGFGCTPSED